MADRKRFTVATGQILVMGSPGEVRPTAFYLLTSSSFLVTKGAAARSTRAEAAGERKLFPDSHSCTSAAQGRTGGSPQLSAKLSVGHKPHQADY